jgi:hypothetical protein
LTFGKAAIQILRPEYFQFIRYAQDSGVMIQYAGERREKGEGRREKGDSIPAPPLLASLSSILLYLSNSVL